MYLIFDTETTGLPKNYNAPLTDFDNWPRMVQLAWQLHDAEGQLIEVKNYIVKPDGYTIPYNAEKIHGISTKRAKEQGVDLSYVLEEFNKDLERANYSVGHNIEFDINIVGCEYLRAGIETSLHDKEDLDTKNDATTNYVAIPGGRGGKFKWPTLTELYQKLFGEGFDEAHNASADVEATARCFLELIRIGVFTPKYVGLSDDEFAAFLLANPEEIQLIGLNIEPYNPNELEGTSEETAEAIDLTVEEEGDAEELHEFEFCHLHNHTQYSVLQATTNIYNLVEKAREFNMSAVAMTDLGNMYGAFAFNQACIRAGIKPIIGCEVYVAEEYKKQKFTKDNPDRRHPLVLLAKDVSGYHNLVKIVSEGYINGFYAGIPRVGKEVIEEFKEGLICLSGGINSEAAHLVLNVGEEQAEAAILYWKSVFGEDYYLELLNHKLDEETHLNEVLAQFGKKHNIELIAGNNNYYLTPEDANAHDILLCVKDGALQSDPIGRGRGYRKGMPNQEFYFKSQEEMKKLFVRYPKAISNTTKIAESIVPFQLEKDPLLPEFALPEGFDNQNDYLRHLTYKGAEKRYPEITDEIRERLDYELKIIKEMGFPGYFLIVQDFTSQARLMGVSVGPGRGSAAGSAVAYCVGITNIDPIEYKLLFERFLNPERISMPDIDIDFDDEGRGAIIEWVVEKYGYKQVAQIVTYGTMAAKSSLRDVGRVLNMPLNDVNNICKIFPDHLSASLKAVLADGGVTKKLSDKLNSDQKQQAEAFRKMSEGSDFNSQVINQAKILEGSVRNTGTHACGVIIAPDDLTNYIPVSTSKDADLLITQFDNKVVEDAGLLKMDFLGLKTLTVIKHAIKLIKEKHNVEIDIDAIPLDDEKTFELYQRGETNGTFQFESVGMQKYLRKLKPTNIEDLIAMNALYRPGPLQFIDSFIDRKHGREVVEYPHQLIEDILKDTNGIMVYQEQIMKTAQIIGGFSLGGADLLRRAMGKKKMDVMQQQKVVFAEGAKRIHDIEEEKSNEIFEVMEKFAEYGFNRSHSAAYSLIAYQTAYLKAHYPAEFMAAVLTNSMNDIKKVTFFMDECRRMAMPVLGPDVNESSYRFSVNDKGEIRFGMGAVKGVGEGAVEAIISERQNGKYTSIFDFTKRIDLRACNKRALESLALAGGFDSFENTHRAQYFYEEGGSTFLEKAIKFGASHQLSENSAQVSLFGESSDVSIPEPSPPECEKWGTLEELSKEKEMVGVFISGHPLDDYRLEIEHFCMKNFHLGMLSANMGAFMGKELKIACIVTEANHLTTKKGKPWGKVKIEDYQGDFELFLFGDDYLNNQPFLTPNYYLFIRGTVVMSRYRNEPEFKVKKMSLLSDLREKIASEISLSVNLNRVDDVFIDELDHLLEKNEGNCKVIMKFHDEKEQIDSKGILRGKKVVISDELIEQLEKLDIGFTMN
ncbi:MAG: DNA polymerase III subunit alpha [Crocinitomicaceae bacterium]|nr:DNA polymerase III subunit alpha [Crocinitomicaceae bacterium]|tara:strand:- start:11939 stop:16237 length:4299 start_codon:yes stop_codon:yes gene_type:complete